jgi:putative adenylate-forming enzyme
LKLVAARAYGLARWRELRLHDRHAVAAYQASQIARLTDDAAGNLAFYRPYRGRTFADWPVIDKPILLQNFSGMNRAGLSAEQIRAALADGKEQLAGHVIGESTGTSGNRGYYVLDDRERFVWLGTILAKALPDALWRRHRVALAMPGLPPLYRSVTGGSRIKLAFFDLALGPESWAADLDAFAPDTIVAPPKILRWLAERDLLHAQNAFSGAEVLDPIDRAVIEAAIGHPVREIYMATEGLFGVSCRHGTLHLAEDVVHFEWSRPDPASSLVAPIVTDFTRRAQGMIRYRMNDLLELDCSPCRCGSPYQAVKRIEGRQDDVFLLRRRDGTERVVTPDVIRNAVVDSHPAIRDFRVVQTGSNQITVWLAHELSAEIDEVTVKCLSARLHALGLAPAISVRRGIDLKFDTKLRRVRRDIR